VPRPVELTVRVDSVTGNSRKRRVLSAVEGVFGPLAQLLLQHGISSPEAESLLRAVCVHEAANAGIRLGAKPNASRVALVTGVDRAEVARILKHRPRVEPWIEMRRHRVNRVLAGWHSDKDFASGKRPAHLQIKASSRSGRTFWALAQRYAPGVYPGLILKELVRTDAVEKLQNGHVRLRTRRYKTRDLTRETIQEMGVRIRDLVQTFISNATGTAWPRVCRAVETTDIDLQFLPLVRKMIADRCEAMLSGMREELASFRWKRRHQSSPRIRIGMTVFSYEERPPETASTEIAKHPHLRATYAPRRRLSHALKKSRKARSN
jgi:hypothetical protein